MFERSSTLASRKHLCRLNLQRLDHRVAAHFGEKCLDIVVVAGDECLRPDLLGKVLEVHLVHRLEQTVRIVHNDHAAAFGDPPEGDARGLRQARGRCRWRIAAQHEHIDIVHRHLFPDCPGTLQVGHVCLGRRVFSFRHAGASGMNPAVHAVVKSAALKYQDSKPQLVAVMARRVVV